MISTIDKLPQPILMQATVVNVCDLEKQILLPHASRVRQNVEYTIINSFEEACQNLVWMNALDVSHLFKSTRFDELNTETSKYVEIADKVYKIGIHPSLARGTIGLSETQKNAAVTGGACDRVYKHINISPFLIEKSQLNNLSEIEFEMAQYKPESTSYISSEKKAPKSHSIIDLHELTDDIKKLFAHLIVSTNQTLLINHKNKHLMLTVKRKVSERAEQFDETHWIGYINQTTKFSFSTKKDSQITIIDEVIKDKTARIFINLKITMKRFMKICAIFLYK